MELHNKAMQAAIEEGRTVDVSKYPRNADGDVILMPGHGQHYTAEDFGEQGLTGYDVPDLDGKDFCLAVTEQWIQSIGRRIGNEEILASVQTKFYGNPDFECVWMR